MWEHASTVLILFSSLQLCFPQSAFCSFQSSPICLAGHSPRYNCSFHYSCRYLQSLIVLIFFASDLNHRVHIVFAVKIIFRKIINPWKQ